MQFKVGDLVAIWNYPNEHYTIASLFMNGEYETAVLKEGGFWRTGGLILGINAPRSLSTDRLHVNHD